MRLPACSPQQQKTEDARAFHEDLWRAYKTGDRVFIATAGHDAYGELLWLSGSRHRFWNSRGFIMRSEMVKRDGKYLGFYLWLTPKVKAEAAA